MGSEESYLDKKTVAGFGQEWTKYNQSELSASERKFLFNKYFDIFPWETLPSHSVGMDMGCGSGRWAIEVAPKVGKLHCVDASAKALDVAKENLKHFTNCEFHTASVSNLPVSDSTLDFIYSLGVLHHIPDTASGIRACVRTLKPGAPFLIYLYYRFDNKPFWYVWLWRVSDIIRRVVSRLPFGPRSAIAYLMALGVYWPLAKLSKLLKRVGLDISSFPLSSYADCSLYTMKTDALDRFGTRLEHRFTKDEIRKMLEQAGLVNIKFSDKFPFWCAVGYRA